MILLLLSSFANLWIWKILIENPTVFLIVIATSILLYEYYKSGRRLVPLIILFSALLIVQIATTQRESLVNLTNDQIRIRDMRLAEYPPVYIKLGRKTVWFPVGHWFEGRLEFRVFTRVLDNFSHVVDPNYYFFANHPRERVGYLEYEKFPYVFLPFFVYGVLILIEGKKRNLFGFLLTPLLLVMFIGSKNGLSVFSIFPFIAVTCTIGIENAYEKIKSLKLAYEKKIVWLFILFFVLIFLQSISYAKG